jgi:CRISPR-associated endonuclease/helicase Cas3
VDDIYAHSARAKDGMRHLLKDHSSETGDMAAVFAEAFGCAKAARYAGQLHDAGKADEKWQAGLLAAERQDALSRSQGIERRRTPVGIDHKTAGAWQAARAAGDMGPLIALMLYGHHNRIPSHAELLRTLAPADADESRFWKAAIDRAALAVPELLDSPGALAPRWLRDTPMGERQLLADLLVRMVGSAIYDADAIDTQQHFHPTEPLLYEGPSLGGLVDEFERNRETRLLGDDSPLAAARQELSDLAREAACLPRGFFRLPYPTGAGKTISAARFAVHHAARWGHQRLIYAAPLRAITAQSAEEMRHLFGAAYVREHHSGVELNKLADVRAESDSPGLRRLAENWDSPVIVTTTVQLFESLFSNRPAALRKVHRIAGSILVLDEVQSLPDRLLPPILSMLRHLTQYFGVTVVLCTATQPAFDALPVMADLGTGGQIRDIIPAGGSFSPRFRRVRYQWRIDPRPTLGQIAGEAAGHEQTLVILNTTKDAAMVHEAMVAAGRADACHLSTRMAAGHRADVLGSIRRKLKQGEPALVASTQLVEAGVNISFPRVYRAWAPAEALCQAAGRANRHGRQDDLGLVIVFDPADGSQPPDYRTAAALTRQLFGPDLADPDVADQLRVYYRKRYVLQDVDGQVVAKDIQQARAALDFPTVARKFRMIDDTGVPVVVDYRPGSAASTELTKLLDLLASAEVRSARVLRAFNPWTATLPRVAAAEALQDGRAEHLIGDLLLWHGPYHPQRGIELSSLRGGPREDGGNGR